MNREIKFRGKTRDGEWVYGYYLPSIYEDVDIITVLEDFNLTQKNYAVLKETVGQFTGLRDKNGKEIYEGDIVEFYYEDSYCINPDCEYHLLGYGSCIRKKTAEVKFEDCVFGVRLKYCMTPLSYIGIFEDEIESLKEREKKDEYFVTNGYEIGSSIVGVKVIGNEFDNPDMIKLLEIIHELKKI